jgi:hypothetical protein
MASLENPMLRGRTAFLQAFLTARFGVSAHDGLGSRQPVANPRPVTELQFQSVGADDVVEDARRNLADTALTSQ